MRAGSASRTRTTSCARPCSSARTPSRRATPASASRRSSCCSTCSAAGIVPYVPARGSVGASGDLAPLAHLALPLVGEGEASVDGRLVDRCTGARRGRARADRARGEGRSLADQRDAVHDRDGLARARPGASARTCRGRRLRDDPRGPPGNADELPSGDPRGTPPSGPGAERRRPARAPRGLGDRRVAQVVRQGAGRVLAPLRTAGARREP